MGSKRRQSTTKDKKKRNSLDQNLRQDFFFPAKHRFHHHFCRTWQVHLNELLAIELRSKKPEPVVKLSPRRTIESQGQVAILGDL